MAMKPCRECGKDVSTKAGKCPHCGVSDPAKSPWNRKIGGGGLLLIILIVLYFVAQAGDGNSRSATIARTARQPTTPAVDTTLSHASIRRQMRDDLTEAQFKALARGIEGRRIRWRGWVEDVNEKALGGYELLVDMDSPTEIFSVQDVTFDIPQNLALSLRKDARITFEGTIRSVLNVMGSLQVGLVDATVVR